MISNGDCDANSNPDSNSHAHADGNSDPDSEPIPGQITLSARERLQGAGQADGRPLLEWGYIEQHRHLS
jgi:hypothetical protein